MIILRTIGLTAILYYPYYPYYPLNMLASRIATVLPTRPDSCFVRGQAALCIGVLHARVLSALQPPPSPRNPPTRSGEA